MNEQLKWDDKGLLALGGGIGETAAVWGPEPRASKLSPPCPRTMTRGKADATVLAYLISQENAKFGLLCGKN